MTTEDVESLERVKERAFRLTKSSSSMYSQSDIDFIITDAYYQGRIDALGQAQKIMRKEDQS